MTHAVLVARHTPNRFASTPADVRLVGDALEVTKERGDSYTFEEPRTGYGERRGGIVGQTFAFVRRRYGDVGVYHAFDEGTSFRGVDATHLHHWNDFTPTPSYLMEKSQIWISLRRARMVTAWTRGTIEELRRRHMLPTTARSLVIPHPHRPVAPGRLPKEYDLLWIGSTQTRKGFPTFLEALAHPSSGHGLRVAVILNQGGGPSTVSQENLARDVPNHRVDLIEYPVPWPEVERLYRSSEFVVATSTREAYHLVTAEALLRGCGLILPSILPFTEVYGEERAALFYRGTTALADQFAHLPSTHPPVSPQFIEAHSLGRSGKILWDLYRDLEATARAS